MEPVLVGVGVDNTAVTHRLIDTGGSFTVNLWSADDTKVFVKFSKPAVLATDGERTTLNGRRRPSGAVRSSGVRRGDRLVRLRGPSVHRLRDPHVLRRRDHRRGDQRRRRPGGGDERHADEVRRASSATERAVAAPPEGARSRRPTQRSAALAACRQRRRDGCASRARRTIRRSVAASISSRWRSIARMAARSMEFGNVMDVTLRSLVDRDESAIRAMMRDRGHPGTPPATAGDVHDEGQLERRRACRSPRDHDPDVAPRRHPAARPRLPDRQHDRPLRGLRARRRRPHAAACCSTTTRRSPSRSPFASSRSKRIRRSVRRLCRHRRSCARCSRRRCVTASTPSGRSWSASGTVVRDGRWMATAASSCPT